MLHFDPHSDKTRTTCSQRPDVFEVQTPDSNVSAHPRRVTRRPSWRSEKSRSKSLIQKKLQLYNRAQLVEIHQVEVKVQPFAYQIGHFVLEVFYGRPGLKALNRGCLRPTSESLTLGADQRASLPWGNGAEGAAPSSSYPARPRTGRACSEKVWPWGAPPVGSYRRRLPLPDCFPCSTPRPRVASSLTTRPAPLPTVLPTRKCCGARDERGACGAAV